MVSFLVNLRNSFKLFFKDQNEWGLRLRGAHVEEEREVRAGAGLPDAPPNLFPFPPTPRLPGQSGATYPGRWLGSRMYHPEKGGGPSTQL